MNLIQSLKVRYGLSQYQLADLTGMSRSHVSLAGLEMRQLPDLATDVLIARHEAFDSKTPLPELETIAPEHRKMNLLLAEVLENHASDCLVKADGLQREYNTMQAAIDLVWRRLHAFRVFRAGFVPIRKNNHLFLQIREDDLETFLNRA